MSRKLAFLFRAFKTIGDLTGYSALSFEARFREVQCKSFRALVVSDAHWQGLGTSALLCAPTPCAETARFAAVGTFRPAPTLIAG